MARRDGDPIAEKLDAILEVLQELVIIEAARAGVTKEGARSILRTKNDRIGRTWKHLKSIRA